MTKILRFVGQWLFLVCMLSWQASSFNLIGNPNFKNVDIVGERIFDNNEQYPWKDPVSIGVIPGKLHNPNWPENTTVCFLNDGRNLNMTQVVRIGVKDPSLNYTLKWNWTVSKDVPADSSGRVIWNDEEVFYMNATGTVEEMMTIKSESISLQAKDGANVLGFEGLGYTPNRGCGITSIELVLEKKKAHLTHP